MAGRLPSCVARVAAFAASAFEHDFVEEKIRRDGRDPIQELFLVMLLNLIEDQPLRAEIFSRGALRFVTLGISETRNAGANREGRLTTDAAQFA